MSGQERSGELPPLNLPAVELRTERIDGIIKVFDRLRDRFVALTPEEFVRQHFVEYLSRQLGYPTSHMANEIGIEVNGMKKRCDTVVFYPDGTLRMIVEYKSPEVRITQAVFDQIVNYNRSLHAQYLVVSNGMSHYCCVMDYEHDSYQFLPQIPAYTPGRTGISEN